MNWELIITMLIVCPLMWCSGWLAYMMRALNHHEQYFDSAEYQALSEDQKIAVLEFAIAVTKWK